MASIRKRNGKYEVQVRHLGQPRLSRTFHDLATARQWARETEIAADRHDLEAVFDRRSLAVTLGELVARYRDTVTVHKRRAYIERIVLNAFALHPICRKSLAHLRTTDFAAYRDDRLKTVKPTTIKRELGPIHNLFEIARDEWGIPIKENPLDKLKLAAPDQRRERRLKEGEFDRLTQAAAKSRNKLIGPVIRFAIETGMRRGEILAIKPAHIDATNQCLLIPETKNGRSRTIPLSPKAVALLLAQPRNMERVFPTSANALQLAWERVRKRAGCEDLHFHDLRHEALSRLFEKGLTTAEVQLISGHRDARMLFRYAHAERKAIAAKLAAA